ncbi:hypothetical protein CONCODRAFT_170487 [Conidiobolus coronatus NRRL 28638]|uniref:Uncharacterized protein n=1 Tax=Conidiobolus coronatus (strain ATCC 28846 / CBS 209.66 / NRRL 28638) TaxID=796925 RepID=A0A137P6N0_CONC2|nr:hypothetical protein CONCODRAFT_170487 [Conidiobolus coronatus NRRL 28638]|eukprot:KXN70658.1 hypothetical protein CONCODRAFT_170487 [Conidiobolus coronatus NRRL 28638]
MASMIWTDIFSWREFTNYFTKNELIILSASCKKLRFKLVPTIFKVFNFNKFTRGNYKGLVLCEDDDGYEILLDEFRTRFGIYDYANCDDLDFNMTINPYKTLEGEFLDSKTKFQSDLKLYHYQPRVLQLIYIDDYFHFLNEIPSVFNKLNTLIIQNSIILIENLNYLLDSLTNLEHFELIRTNIFKRKQDTVIQDINLPLSLRKLKIGNNCFDNIDEREEAAILETYHFIELEFNSQYVQPKNLPNLLDLDFEPTDEGSENELYEFLKVNSHVKKLSVYPSRFTSEFLNIIKDFHNLTHLDLISVDLSSTSNDYIANIKMNNFSKLYNLENLKLGAYRDTDILHSMAQTFPNVTNLTVQSKFITYDLLCPAISKFEKLKTLKLFVYPRVARSNDFNFVKFNNLESIEFNVDLYDKYEDFKWDISLCPKLKLVKFTKINYYVYFDRPKLTPELANSWTLSYFPTKITFYKIN